MATIKRGRGRPRKSKNKPEESDTYVFYDSVLEQKEFTGDVIYPSASIIKVSSTHSSPSEWVTKIEPNQFCLQDDCQKLHFHCPLCPVSVTQFDEIANLQSHFVKIHANQYFIYSDHVIALCNLGCMDSFVSHYHCPKCGVKIGRSLHMRNHLNRCTAEHKVKESDAMQPKKPVAKKKPRLCISDNNLDSLWETVCVKLDKSNSDLSAALRASINDFSSKENLVDENSEPCWRNGQGEEGDSPQKDLSPTNDTIKNQDNRHLMKSIISYEAADDKNSNSGPKVTSDPTQLYEQVIDTKCSMIDNTDESLHNPEQEHSVFTKGEGQADDRWMDKETLLAPAFPHVSIVRKLEDLECRRCQTCCRLFHCPLCPHDLYRSQPPRVIYNHLSEHYLRGVQYRGWTSMKCNLACGCDPDVELVKAHWHCPLCPQRKLHRSRLRQHLEFHEHGRTRSCRGKSELNSTVIGIESVAAVDDKQAFDNSCLADALNAATSCHTDGEQSISNCNTDVPEPAMPLDTVYTIKMEHDNVSGSWHVNGTTSDDSKNTSQSVIVTPASASAVSHIVSDGTEESLSCSLSSGPNKPEIHVVYINDLLNAGNSAMGQAENSVILHKTFASMEPPETRSENLMIGDDGNIVITGDDNIIIQSNGTLRIDKMLPHGDSDGAAEEDKNTVMQTDGKRMIQDETSGRSGEVEKDDNNKDDDDNTCTGEKNRTSTPEENKTNTHKPSEVFQVVTGVLTADLIQKLEPVLDQFMSCLQDIAGVSVILQDTQHYLVQGSWTQIYKSQIILDKVSLWQQLTTADIHSVFDQAQREHPDLFHEQRKPDDDSTITDQDSELGAPGDKVKDMEQTEGGFRITSNEPCPYCKKRFRYKVSLFYHILYTHDIRKKPKFNSQKWKTMLRRMAEVDQPQCPSCGRKFTKVIHAQTHYGTNVCTSLRSNVYASLRDPATGMYRCKECNYSAITPSVLMQHVTYKHTKKTFSCTKCAKMFATTQILQSHLKTVHAPYVLCSVCGIRIKRCHLAKHMRGHQCQNNRGMPSLKCSHCGYYTNTPQLLERHVQREHHLEAKRCTECGKHFQVMYDLYRHRQREHGVVMSKFLSMYGHCPVCRKQMLKRNILVHVRLKHYNDRRYRCTTCNKTFQTRYVLNMHRETHLPSSERNYRYICAKCNMGFMTKTTYIDHVGTHDDTQHYACSVCGITFRQKNLYKRHLLTHKQTKYVCEICQETCDSKESLDSHKKSHLSDDPAELGADVMVVCLCKQAFSDRTSLQEHTKSCLMMQQNPGAIDNSSTSTSEILTQSTTAAGGDTLILIQPESDFVSERSILSASQLEMFVVKTDDADGSRTLPDDVQGNDGDVHNVSVQQLDIERRNEQINLTDPDQLSMELGNSTGDGYGTEVQDGFLCGYCSTLFVGLHDVEKHILTVHGDKLSS